MVPDNESSKNMCVLYALDDGKNGWIEIGNLLEVDSTPEKESIFMRFGRKIKSTLKGIR